MIYVSTLIILIALISVCIVKTVRSPKDIARHVLWVLVCVLFPLMAHIVIYSTEDPFIAMCGYMLYYLGTNMLLAFLIRYVMHYCDFKFEKTFFQYGIIVILGCDSLLVLLNFFGHRVFDVIPILLLSGKTYMSVLPGPYYPVHIGVSFAMVILSILPLLSKMIIMTRMYAEKYLVIFLSLLLTALWEAFYVIPVRPIDMSMFGYATCAMLIYFFSMEYVPKTLVNHIRKIVVSTVSDGLFFFDRDRNCVYINEKGKDIFGIRGDDYSSINAKLQEVIGLSDEQMREVKSHKCRCSIGQDDGKHIYDIEVHKLYAGNGTELGAFTKFSDRTEEIERNMQDHYNATHDRLTGLYNAEEFYRKVEEKIASEPGTEFYAIASDIKEFKLVNDRYGKEAGDKILVRVAREIKDKSDSHMVFGRIGSDKFALLMQKSRFHPEAFMEGITKIPNLEIDSIFPIVTHVGVYEVKERDIPASVMFDRAFMAIAPIKNDLSRRLAFYDDNLKADLLWEQHIAGTVDDAIADGQIVPYLQAQVRPDGTLTGAEVLVRWQHPERGFLTPDRFIPVLEKTGTIAKVDRFMWESACKILAGWKSAGITGRYLSVNISPKDLYLLDVPSELNSLVSRYGISPANLRLEITESIMMEDVQEKIATINKLRETGFIVEMDDFGSGYSSLNMLKDLPIDILKLDMLFLSDTGHPERTEAITDLIINLAKALHMPVIAEGVETKEQAEMLREKGCDYFQGYYFARPVCLSDFEKANGMT